MKEYSIGSKVEHPVKRKSKAKEVKIDLYEDNRDPTIGVNGTVISVVKEEAKEVKPVIVEKKPESELKENKYEKVETEEVSYDEATIALLKLVKVLFSVLIAIAFIGLVINVIMPIATAKSIEISEDAIYNATGFRVDLNGDGKVGNTSIEIETNTGD